VVVASGLRPAAAACLELLPLAGPTPPSALTPPAQALNRSALSRPPPASRPGPGI
jgi:hypothetical protein